MSGPVSSPGAGVSRRVALTGAAASLVASDAMAQSLGDFLHRAANPPPPGAANAPPAANAHLGRQSLLPKGYSERFAPVRDLIAKGEFDAALLAFEPTHSGAPGGKSGEHGDEDSQAASTKSQSGVITKDAILLGLESGLIQFEAGRYDASRAHFDAVEEALTAKAAPPKPGFSDRLRQAGDLSKIAGGKVIGREDWGPYRRFDHETVLELNYLSLNYLLMGQRKCYNVTRRCITEQDDLKKKFEQQIADFKAKHPATPPAAKPGAKPAASVDSNSSDQLAKEFGAYDAIADVVPNAYVNPLGDYLAGVIQEIASSEQPALRDNSRISYEAAVALCGASPQLTAAAAAMKRARKPVHERIVHVIVAEGFAPSRLVLTFGVAIGGQAVPVRVPIFTPIPSVVNRIQMVSSAGKTISTLDPIGNFEAIVLRDQKDRQAQILLSVLASTAASVGEGKLASHLGVVGLVANGVREATASPDTRSWSSLPRRFHVARFVVPPTMSSFELRTIDSQGRRLAGEPLRLDPANPHSIVYARATDAGLKVQAARKLWIDGRLEMT